MLRRIFILIVPTTVFLFFFLSLDTPKYMFPNIRKGVELPYSSDPILSLSSLASLTPPVAPSSSCSPPEIPSIPSCSSDPGLTGKLLSSPRKLVLMMLFGFEVDTLEISLREQLNWVDTVFIVEATTTPKGVSY